MTILWHGNSFPITDPLWGKPPVTGGSPPTKGQSCGALLFCDASLNKLLNKQSSCRRFEMPWPISPTYIMPQEMWLWFVVLYFSLPMLFKVNSLALDGPSTSEITVSNIGKRSYQSYQQLASRLWTFIHWTCCIFIGNCSVWYQPHYTASQPFFNALLAGDAIW